LEEVSYLYDVFAMWKLVGFIILLTLGTNEVEITLTVLAELYDFLFMDFADQFYGIFSNHFDIISIYEIYLDGRHLSGIGLYGSQPISLYGSQPISLYGSQPIMIILLILLHKLIFYLWIYYHHYQNPLYNWMIITLQINNQIYQNMIV